MDTNFRISALVDFYDDASEAVYGPENVDALMRLLKKTGVCRVYWAHYGDASYEFCWKETGIKDSQEENRKKTIEKLGQPIKVAAEAAKRNGLEIYGYIKPYENGISMVLPGDDPKASEKGYIPHLGGSLPISMRFVKEHPEMRIKRRAFDIPPDLDKIPFCTIRLYKKNDDATRIKRENIQIWTSDANTGYQRKAVRFDFSEEILPAACDFLDFNHEVITKKGSPVRVLTISGLHLDEKYILLTTNFKEGPGDFENSEFHIIEAFGPSGLKMPISIGLKHEVWTIGGFNFRETGIVFDDSGLGRELVRLDLPNTTGEEGFIAFTRGRNRYLPTALCESYQEVRDFWLDMVKECLDAGVDGVDFRIENHSCHTSDPFAYGYNDVILSEYQRRYGCVWNEQDYSITKIARIRGDFYTQFLKEANILIHSYGKKMQAHLNAEFFRPDPPASRILAYPWNITFDWKKWIDWGILDEATLRTYIFKPEFVLSDRFSNEMIDACRSRNIPIHYNCYMRSLEHCFSSQEYAEQLEHIYNDGRFKGFILYETADFIKSDEKEGVTIKEKEYLEAVHEKAEELVIL